MSARESGSEKLRYSFEVLFDLNKEDDFFKIKVNYNIYVGYKSTGLFSTRPYFSKIEESCVRPDDENVTWTATREYDGNGNLIEDKAKFLVRNKSKPDEDVLEQELQFLAKNCKRTIQQTENIEEKYSWFEKKVETSNLTDRNKGEIWCQNWVVTYSVMQYTFITLGFATSKKTFQNFIHNSY